MAFVKKTAEAKRPKDGIPDIETPQALIKFAKDNGLYEVPINVAAIARALGISVRYEPMADENSGSLKKEKKTGRWIMTINSLHHPHRQRFTMAHEIAHRVCHADGINSFEDKAFFRNKESNPMEWEANNFAAELIMPEDEFHKCVTNYSTKVEDIAKYFHVSSMAVRVRAKQLGYSGHNL